MSDWPDATTLGFAGAGVVSVASERHEVFLGAATSFAWPSANLAIFFPLRLPIPVTVYKLAVGCGSTAGGNFDAGIFDQAGNKLVSTGATARVADSEVIVDVTDTRLGPGLYYFGMSADGTDAYFGGTVTNLSKGRILGMMQQATAYPLPSQATYAQFAQARMGAVAAYLRRF